MIVVNLQGGHSNQLFQYAAARRLALNNNTTVGIDLERLQGIRSDESTREYELDVYNIQAKIVKHSQVRFASSKPLRQLVKRIVYRNQVYTYYANRHEFDPKVLELGNNIFLEGEFQNEAYFKDIREILLQDLTYINKPNKRNAKLLEEITNNPSAVSLHVRRGDYVSLESARVYHGALGLDYYKKAVKFMVKQIKNPTFYIFSDDPEWCKKNLKLDYPAVYVDFNSKGSDDMRLMRACKHNIMANSSFSWWGAWLNENPRKIVFAPKQWFIDPKANAQNLLVKGWKTL